MMLVGKLSDKHLNKVIKENEEKCNKRIEENEISKVNEEKANNESLMQEIEYMQNECDSNVKETNIFNSEC